jgi:hypothetical protein
MPRPQAAILLAVVSAILILIGRINADAWWGIWVLAAGFALLVLAFATVVRANR